MRLWALLLVATLVCCTLVHAQFSSRISAGELFRYTFEEGQLDETAAAAIDTTGRNPLGSINLNTAACSLMKDRPGLLLSGGVLEVGSSQGTLASVLNAVQAARAFTMEAWFQPGNLDQASMIFGFGLWGAPVINPACWADALTFEFHQAGGNFGAHQAQGTATSKACSKQEDFFETTSLIQLLITYSANATARVYLNGQYNGQFGKVYTWYPYWYPSHKLFLTPDLDVSGGGSTWRGSLHLISMYDRILTSDEIATNYAAGLPNAKPQPLPRRQHLTAYQDSPSTHNLSLAVTDVDTPLASVSLHIMSVPARGTLQLRLGGGALTTVTTAMLPLKVEQADLRNAVFTPAPGVHGVGIANFTFAGHDGAGGSNSFGRRGVVLFDVVPLPEARDSTVQAYAGVEKTVVLEASNAVSVFDAWVTTLPTMGTLYQTTDGVTPSGPAIVAANLPLRVTDPAHRMVYVSSALAVGSGACFFDDSLKFFLRLPSGLESRPAQTILRVCNRLSVRGANVTARPLAAVPIDLVGESMLPGETVVFVLGSVPTVGKLYLPNGETLAAGLVVARATQISYRRTLSAASTVSLADDSFSFQMFNGAGMLSPAATVSLRTSAAAFETRVSAGLLALYLFNEGQADPSTTLVRDVSAAKKGGDLSLASPAAVQWLDNSAGLLFVGTKAGSSTPRNDSVSPSVVSTTAGGGLLLYTAMQSSQTFTLELWTDSLTSPLPDGVMLGLGRRGADGEFAFDVALIQSNIAFSATGAQQSQSWFDLGAFEDPPRIRRRHLVLGCGAGRCTLLVDGATVMQFASGALPVRGAGDSVQLVIGEGKSDGNTRYKWAGNLYLVAVYDRLLSAEEIARNYAAGLQAPKPQARPQRQEVTVREYSTGDQPLPLVMASVAFNSTLTGAGAVVDPQAKLDHYISSLPAFGTLRVHQQGQLPRPLTPSVLPFLFDPLSASLSFLPPPGQFWGRDADAFGFVVSDGTSMSPKEALVSISVSIVVNPPLTVNVAVDGYELTPLRVQMAGKDVDLHEPHNSPMDAYWLLELPRAGTLYAGLAGGGGINLAAPFLPGQISLPYRVAASLPLWFVSAEANTDGTKSVVGTDSFRFRSEVKSTQSNSTGLVSFTLRNHLVAGNGAGSPGQSVRLDQPPFDSSVARVLVNLVGGIVPNTGPNSYLPAGGANSSTEGVGLEEANFVLLQRPLYGNVTAIDGGVLCPAVPCLVPASFYYSRDWMALPSSHHQSPDTLIYASTSSIVKGESTFRMHSLSASVGVSVAPPRVAPSFVRSFQSLQAQTVKAYSSTSYNFSLAVVDPDGGGTGTHPEPEASLAAYRVTMSVFPATAGFNLPQVASDPAIAARVTFVSGGPDSNSVAVFTVPDVPTLNRVFEKITFQPLFVGQYNLTVVVASSTGGGAGAGSGIGGAQQTQTSAVVVWSVSEADSASNGSSSSDGGIFSFLSGSNLIYIWCGLGGAAFLLLGYVARKKYVAYRRAAEIKRKKAEKKEAKLAAEEEAEGAQKKMMQAVMQLTAVTAANLNSTTTGGLEGLGGGGGLSSTVPTVSSSRSKLLVPPLPTRPKRDGATIGPTFVRLNSTVPVHTGGGGSTAGGSGSGKQRRPAPLTPNSTRAAATSAVASATRGRGRDDAHSVAVTPSRSKQMLSASTGGRFQHSPGGGGGGGGHGRNGSASATGPSLAGGGQFSGGLSSSLRGSGSSGGSGGVRFGAVIRPVPGAFTGSSIFAQKFGSLAASSSSKGGSSGHGGGVQASDVSLHVLDDDSIPPPPPPPEEEEEEEWVPPPPPPEEEEEEAEDAEGEFADEFEDEGAGTADEGEAEEEYVDEQQQEEAAYADEYDAEGEYVYEHEAQGEYELGYDDDAYDHDGQGEEDAEYEDHAGDGYGHAGHHQRGEPSVSVNPLSEGMARGR